MLIDTNGWIFLVLLTVVAFLYSSVGHGGASGYLALMALFGVTPELMKSSALVLNIIVALISFSQYYYGGYFKWKLFLVFAASSIPASFLGAYLTLDPYLYKKILGILLFFPVLRLSGIIGKTDDSEKEPNIVLALFIGALIGLFSGMIGIGGGIILSPVILILHWANMKQTAAVSALFIFVNSVSGLSGLLIKGDFINGIVYGWVLAAILGAVLGAYFGRKIFSGIVLKRALAMVLAIAGLKLLMVVS